MYRPRNLRKFKRSLPRVLASVLAVVALSAAGVAHAQQVRDDDAAARRLVAAALERTHHAVTYDGAYRRIAYPGGDVAPDRGVCSDVVVRAYRAGLGIDLQAGLHRDMRRAFAAYPKSWGLRRPDPNIDHRRVPNLEAFFARHGRSLPVSRDGADYRPGDLVTWRLGGRLPHIGIVTDRRSADGRRPLIVHNIGAGPKLEDMLFEYPIRGHYRFLPPGQAAGAG